MEGTDFTGLLESLGWALADSLWQTGALWAIYIAVTANRKKFSAGARHNLALAGLFGGSVWFLVTFFTSYAGMLTGHPVRSLLRQWLHNGYPQAIGLELPVTIPSLVSVIYLIIILFQVLRMAYGYYVSRKSLYKSLTPPSEELLSLMSRLVNTSGVRRRVKLWLSSAVDAPFTMGFLKPVIILPVALLNHLSAAQAEAILVHELSHIRRSDYLVNLMTTLSATILFFNPFARLLLKNIHVERENSCDDAVAAQGYNRWEYAQALYLVSMQGQAAYPFALQAAAKSTPALLSRVQRLLNRNMPAQPVWKPAAAFFLCLSLAILRPSAPAEGLAVSAVGMAPPAEGLAVSATSLAVPTEGLATPPEKPSASSPPPSVLQLVAVNEPSPASSKDIAVRPANPDPAENVEAPRQTHLESQVTPVYGFTAQAQQPVPMQLPVAAPPVPDPAGRIVITTITRFVSTDQAEISFTYLQTTSALPASANDGTHPFVPSTAFYYPQIDENCGDGPVIVL